MEFLDNIENVVKNESGKGFKQKEYDFNDDAKEVLLEETDLVPERKGSSGSGSD